MKIFVVYNYDNDCEPGGKWFKSRPEAEAFRREKCGNNFYSTIGIMEVECGHTTVTVTMVSQFYGVPRNTVLNWVRNGHIKAFRIGHKWMIEASSLPSFNVEGEIL